MHAQVGDRLMIHGRKVGERDRGGTVLEVRGGDGNPPYLVRFDDGHEGLVYPGPDCVLSAGPERGASTGSA
jgi:Domain of unknown function (DUF1918)